jgi:hypothetical protein
VRFEISHELDAPLDVVELAVLSPDLGPRMVRSLSMIASVETVEHEIKGGELRRVLRFHASAPLPIFKNNPIAREAMTWQELTTYRLADHSSTWTIFTKDEWRRYFRSQGTYRLERAPDGRTRRIVMGDLEIRLSLLGPVVERMALAEVRKTYDAEAETLREFSTL